MSTVFFLRDPIFWSALIVLDSFWLWGFLTAWNNNMATPTQMMRKQIFYGIPWTGHFGFWFLLIVLHPVLAWATAKMWPIWVMRPGIIVMMLITGLLIGYMLQRHWSVEAGSNDAWSEKGLPNVTGLIHILHMSPEIGIMLMCLASWVWYREMPIVMFLGLFWVIACHFLIGGTHWPIRMYGQRAPWAPKELRELRTEHTILFIICSGLSLITGIFFLATS